MKTGAFAFLDCLGFKGIWERENPDLVLEKLVEVDEHFILESSVDTASFSLIKAGLINLKILCISDSIAVSVTFNENVPRAADVGDFHLVGAISMIVSTILDRYLLTKPHLILRGCITFGEHAIDRNFIIGPAVDEAVEIESKADGAFVRFTPKADELLRQFDDHLEAFVIHNANDMSIVGSVTDEELEQIRLSKELLKNTGSPPSVIRNFKLPQTKGLPGVECTVVNPLATSPSPEEIEKRIEIFHSEMESSRPDVKIKQFNTDNFLRHCQEVTATWRASVAQHFLSSNYSNDTPSDGS